MKRALVLIVLAGSLRPGPGAAQEPPRPPLPSPAVSPATVDSVPIPPAPIPSPPPLPGDTVAAPGPRAGITPKRAKKKPGPLRIVLGNKTESDHPTWAGAGVNKPAKFEVNASGGTLTAKLNGVADSHAFWGIPSATYAPIQFVQEFEIVAGNPDATGVMVAFSGKLAGYVRSEKHSSAALRQADAVIYPVDGGPSVTLGFTPCSACEGTASPCVGNSPGEPQLMPPGKYVLVITLVLDTCADGVFRGHSVAVFAPKFNAGFWRAEAEELEGLEDGDFGLSITLKATRADSN